MIQKQFEAILPFISADLISMITEKQHIAEKDAVKKLYASKLYSALEKEETKVWQYSTPMLYSLLEQEEDLGNIIFPDV